MAEVTNLERRAGTLAEMLVGADVFVGVSGPGTVTSEMVKTMAPGAIIFACANPTPEIFPDEAKAGGAADRTQRLPEPDQQRAGVPGDLPGDLRCAGAGHQRGDEDGGGEGAGGADFR